MKRSTRIVLVLGCMLVLAAGLIAAWVVWGTTVFGLISVGIMVPGIVYSFWTCRRTRRWEHGSLAMGYLFFAAGIIALLLLGESAAGKVVFPVLLFLAIGCIYAAPIGMWRRRRAEKRTKSQHPETTRGA